MSNVEKLRELIEEIKERVDSVLDDIEEDCDIIIEREQSDEWKAYAEEWNYRTDDMTGSAYDSLCQAIQFLGDLEGEISGFHDLATMPLKELF